MQHEEKISKTPSRKLKVYEKHFPRAWYQYARFPEIRLAGKWLEDMGVQCGRTVTVRKEEDRIIITVDEEVAVAVPKRRDRKKVYLID